jgi:iron complex outermembrane receptor protein
MTVSVTSDIERAVKRALAASAMAICGAGCLAAYGQQAFTPQPSIAQATTTPLTATGSRMPVAKAATAKAHIMLAQAPPPANATPGSAPELQTVVVTGSLIARTSLETPSPVQVISDRDLIQSGYTDFSSVLKNITANGANTLSQSFAGAFAAGASGVSLRGLTVGDTLVLIDGERTVPYPLLDDNQRSFVDLASIPFTAIQSVQVDKNGASGVYGSDAIAGVVNVILKKEYQGFKVSAETGTSQRGDATMEHVGFIGGMGDLATDGYNWYISGDFRHQDQILARNRSGLWDNLDWTPWGGNFGNAITNIGASTATNPFFSYPQSITGYLIDPATGTIVDYLPGCTALAQSMNKCLAISPDAQLQPPTTRADVLAKFTKQLGDQWRLGIQASWFNSSSEEVAGYSATDSGNVVGLSNPAFGPGIPFHIVPASSLVTPNIITIPTSNPMYPTSCDAATDPEKCSWFGLPLASEYKFPELGKSTEQTNTYTYRLLASLDGTAAGWAIHATAGAMYSKADLHYVGGDIDWQELQSALNNGYVFGSSGANALFAPTMIATPWSSLDLLDVHGQHELLELPGGPLELAAGVQYVKEVHDERAPPNAEAGLQAEGGGPVYVIGTQKDAAAFIELDGDPVKHLEIDAAGRYDNYQGVGSAFTPQLGVKFTPWRWIGLRGTYGKGFRAPSAAEGGQSGELFGAGAYQDPALCPTATPSGMVAGPGDFPGQCGVFVTGFQQANPHLQNVKSTNWTGGLILQPIEAVSVTVDYYNIKVTNDIISAFEAGGLGNYTALTRGAPVLQQYCPPTFTGGCTSAELVNQTTPVGLILAATYPYVNAGQTHTTGFDVDLKAHYDAGRLGRLTAEATWTHLLTYQLTFNGNTYELAGTHGPSGVSGDTGSPKDRASLKVSWQKGPLTLAPSVDFIGHFNITDPSSGVTTCAQGLGFIGYITSGVTPQNSAFCSVGYYLQTDVYGAYQVNGHFQLHAAVTNLFNKVPPVDLQTYGSGTYNYPYDAAFEQGGAVGRFFTLGLTYDF